ncbi:hypothetical protein [Nitritalea halalkaliphila]|uniref:hypothetical protein n=1 Tax=Nitritalea halalkaliphila TaxID=590849 RepID=UPI0012EADEC3|nr:hypothetical protein [Nitritalea halalkaliphila]
MIHGLSGIPSEWISGLRDADIVLEMGEDLAISVQGATFAPDAAWEEKYSPF